MGDRGLERKRRRGLSLYYKFTLAIIVIGLVPVVILSTFLANRMIEEYRKALRSNYEQAADYVAGSLETMLDTYNTASKMPYNYSYSIREGYVVKDYLYFDNLRQILSGEGYDSGEREEKRAGDMADFLEYVESVDSYISGTHFIVDNEALGRMDFHYSAYSTFFKDEERFEEAVRLEGLDKSSNQMMLVPTHATGYFSGLSAPVFTVARNYFDLRGEVGNTPYVGTLFIDVNVSRMERVFRTVNFSDKEIFYVVNDDGDCFYSSDGNAMGRNIKEELEGIRDTDRQLVLHSQKNGYGLHVMAVLDTAVAFGGIRSVQRMMYVFLAAACLVLLCGSLFFSRKLTRPIRNMMEKMSEVESGNFDIQLPVESRDEIGILSERFNQMSSALKAYINQSYVAAIKQTEAELTALKSQIYPHFLYNTLEIIRMTALENEDVRVSEMIEALSQQIHYLIGPVQDMVSLEKELDIVRKYVYLLNCRIDGKVQLMTEAPGAGRLFVPKLILQPIVENAYVHGIKPKKGVGSIMVEAAVNDREDGEKRILEITVMDNGVGMDQAALDQIQELLAGDEPGIKNEYNWQSIGMKNVHDRIRLLYGEEYGIRVTSTVGVGTMVRLLMPVTEREGQTDGKDDTGR